MSPADDLSETSPSPELEFLGSTEDALSAFLAEETAGKPHSRGQRLAVRTAVLIAVCGSLAVVLILAVVTRSRWSGGGSLALIPAPSVVGALPDRPRVPLPEPPRVPAAPVIAADLTPPNSG